MSWIKTEHMKPPTHEIILFMDIYGNEHYGVLCGELAEKKNRNKYWCHIFQKTYKKDEVLYWCDIPINKHMLSKNIDFANQVNSYLWETMSKIEEDILKEFKQHKKEHPDWDADNFVRIALRNALGRMSMALKGVDL